MAAHHIASEALKLIDQLRRKLERESLTIWDSAEEGWHDNPEREDESKDDSHQRVSCPRGRPACAEFGLQHGL